MPIAISVDSNLNVFSPPQPSLYKSRLCYFYTRSFVLYVCQLFGQSTSSSAPDKLVQSTTQCLLNVLLNIQGI